MKIVTIVGARPQFIKAAMVSKEIANYPDIEEIIVHTGQHYDANMSAVFFDEMHIPRPTYNLNINGKSHTEMTADMMQAIEKVLIKEQPDCVLVYGDTNSTLAGALTARKLNIKIIHVEGGLRNFDLTIPEDVNRILTDRVSDYIFCSTEAALKNLANEGYAQFPCKIYKTGDLMADSLIYYSAFAKDRAEFLDRYSLDSNSYILCTVHRESNTKPTVLKEIVKALNEISKQQQILFPIHPRTAQVIKENDLTLNSNIVLISPVGYLDMLSFLCYSGCVITDSGGLQREAYVAQKKSLLLMDFTPWEELVEGGFSVLTVVDHQNIIENYYAMKQQEPNFNSQFYGDGHAAHQIVRHLKNIFI